MGFTVMSRLFSVTRTYLRINFVFALYSRLLWVKFRNTVNVSPCSF